VIWITSSLVLPMRWRCQHFQQPAPAVDRRASFSRLRTLPYLSSRTRAVWYKVSPPQPDGCCPNLFPQPRPLRMIPSPVRQTAW
jgi:hypothetical protein